LLLGSKTDTLLDTVKGLLDKRYRASSAIEGFNAYSGEFGHLIHWKPAAHSGGKRPFRPEEKGHPVIAQAKRELLLLLLFGIGCQF
jgi:hypothetical protein